MHHLVYQDFLLLWVLHFTKRISLLAAHNFSYQDSPFVVTMDNKTAAIKKACCHRLNLTTSNKEILVEWVPKNDMETLLSWEPFNIVPSKLIKAYTTSLQLLFPYERSSTPVLDDFDSFATIPLAKMGDVDKREMERLAKQGAIVQLLMPIYLIYMYNY